jgi:hypothetical protein
VNWTGVPSQTGELDVQLQSGPAAIVTSLLHSFEQPPAVTLTLSVVVPTDPAVNVIDWLLVADVIRPLVIDQAYAAPAVSVEALLPVDPAQTEGGAAMVQSGPEVIVTSLLHSFEQPPAITLTLSPTAPEDPAVKVIDWMLIADVISPL